MTRAIRILLLMVGLAGTYAAIVTPLLPTADGETDPHVPSEETQLHFFGWVEIGRSTRALTAA